MIAAEDMRMQVTLQKPGSRAGRKVGWELEGASEAEREVCLVGDDICASMTWTGPREGLVGGREGKEGREERFGRREQSKT